MTNMAVETLRTFALSHNEMAFVHLCTAALNGDVWAAERIAAVLKLIGERSASLHAHVAVLKTQASPEHRAYFEADVSPLTLEVIRGTDTTRPDGTIPRSFKP